MDRQTMLMGGAGLAGLAVLYIMMRGQSNGPTVILGPNPGPLVGSGGGGGSVNPGAGNGSSGSTPKPPKERQPTDDTPRMGTPIIWPTLPFKPDDPRLRRILPFPTPATAPTPKPAPTPVTAPTPTPAITGQPAINLEGGLRRILPLPKPPVIAEPKPEVISPTKPGSIKVVQPTLPAINLRAVTEDIEDAIPSSAVKLLPGIGYTSPVASVKLGK